MPAYHNSYYQLQWCQVIVLSLLIDHGKIFHFSYTLGENTNYMQFRSIPENKILVSIVATACYDLLSVI